MACAIEQRSGIFPEPLEVTPRFYEAVPGQGDAARSSKEALVKNLVEYGLGWRWPAQKSAARGEMQSSGRGRPKERAYPRGNGRPLCREFVDEVVRIVLDQGSKQVTVLLNQAKGSLV